MTFPLDHLVINVLFDMDRAAGLMSRLGFTVTPRGYHSLGSINHLMVFEGPYLELIGLPQNGAGVLRKDLLESPKGLNGLVFKADDIDTSVGILRGGGLAMLEPESFSRPVAIDGVEHLARFRTVRTAPDLFEAGRVYYCQHYTPELVWRHPLMSHGNGCSGLSELIVVTASPQIDLERYARAAQGVVRNRGSEIWSIDLDGGFCITLMSQARYRERYGECCIEASGQNSFFGALVLKASDLGPIRGLAASIPELRAEADAHSLALLVPFLNTLLEFRSDR
jgi:glyoxalase-like protein